MPFFQEAERLNVNGGNFFDASNNVINVNGSDTRKGEGIKLLLASSVQREAIHDSDARGALGCHPGTREEYIRNIISWGSGKWESEKRAFLMTGPAGAGKSAIARTCAHKIEEACKLGASFFFFRPSGWNDPKKFIPTIVYQLTTRYSAYRDCIDAVILDDPLVLEKAMDIQFRELLIKPLLKPSVSGHNIESDLVIIVDGLDECATVDAQIQIIEIITTSIHERTTPFLWAFFSRPEPPITSAFSSEIATTISWKLPLTLSGNAKSDIEAYLRGSFQVIRAKYNIPANVAWPTEEDIRHLVSRSAGLFVYAATAIRYIGGLGKGTSGLEDRLRAILELDSRSRESPFSALDQLYILVMMQIPDGVLSDTMSLLYLDQSPAAAKYGRNWRESMYSRTSMECPMVQSYCFALGLSPAAFHAAISNLYSVLAVTTSESGALVTFQFYHKSFLDFLLDSRRSKQYFVKSPGVRQHCLEMVIRTTCTGVNAASIVANKGIIESFAVQAFFTLIEEHDRPLENNILLQISKANWNFFHHLSPNHYQIDFRTFIQKIPIKWHSRIVRPSSKGLFGTVVQKLAGLMSEQYDAEAYTLGEGDRKGLIVRGSFRPWRYYFSEDEPRSASTM